VVTGKKDILYDVVPYGMGSREFRIEVPIDIVVLVALCRKGSGYSVSLTLSLLRLGESTDDIADERRGRFRHKTQPKGTLWIFIDIARRNTKVLLYSPS